MKFFSSSEATISKKKRAGIKKESLLPHEEQDSQKVNAVKEKFTAAQLWDIQSHRRVFNFGRFLDL